jgi:hypothetical protein
MKIKVIGIAAIAFGLCGAVGAFAGDGNKGAGADDKFAKMDTNSDGKVTSSEHAAGSSKMFADSDANKDGSLTADEMTSAHQKHMADK